MSAFWDRLLEGLKDIGGTIGDVLPDLLGALIILVVGWFVARLIRNVVQRLLDRPAVDKLLDRAGVGTMLKNAGYSGASLLATLVYAVVVLGVLVLAAEALEIESIVGLLSDLTAFLPLLIAALVILVLASAIGSFVADLLAPWGESKDMPWVPTFARVALIVFGVVTALDVIGIGAVTTRIFEFGLGAVAVAVAVAFGVGGIDTAKQWWVKHLAPRD